MSVLARYAIKIFRLFIHCYPASFRREFENEMTADFVDSLIEAQKFGIPAYFKLLIFEYSHIIRTALHLHNESSRRGTPRDSGTWEGPPGWVESILTLSVFVIPGMTLYMGNNLSSSGFILWVGVLLILVLMFGLINGLPRWSLPYLGLALSVVSFLYIFQWAADLTADFTLRHFGMIAQNESEQMILQAFWAGFAWISLFTTTYLVLRFLALLRLFQLTLQRIRQDWTQASFILYSGTVLTLFMSFSEHHRKEEFVIASTLCLATGAWMYLNSKQPAQRLLSLSAGGSLALMAAAAGLIPGLPVTEWAAWIVSQPAGSNNIMAMRKILFELIWLLILLLAPAFLRILPGNSAENINRRVI